MNADEFTRRVDRIREVNEVIKGLDPEIRAEAFNLLKGYITGGPDEPGGLEGQTPKEVSPSSKKQFFSKFDHEKPADNAFMIAAYHYSQYGNKSISTKEVKDIAADVGLTIPDRVDRTFKVAQRKNKKLFQSAGRGKYRPTVSGESFLREEYKVSKGTKKKPDAKKE